MRADLQATLAKIEIMRTANQGSSSNYVAEIDDLAKMIIEGAGQVGEGGKLFQWIAQLSPPRRLKSSRFDWPPAAPWDGSIAGQSQSPFPAPGRCFLHVHIPSRSNPPLMSPEHEQMLVQEIAPVVFGRLSARRIFSGPSHIAGSVSFFCGCRHLSVTRS